GVAIAVVGLGFGLVTQVLIVAVQNSVDRSQLGIATAATGFFRALGGAVGAAVLGAVFAARVGADVAGVQSLGAAGREDVIHGVQAVFAVAAPVAAIALIVVLRLPELPLRAGAPGGGEERSGGDQAPGAAGPRKAATN